MRQLLLVPWTPTEPVGKDCTAAQQAAQQQLITAAKLHALVAEAAACVLGQLPLGFAAVGSRDAPAAALNNALQDPEPAVAAAAALLVPLALVQTATLSKQKAAAPVGSKLLQRGVSMLQGLLPIAKPVVDAAVARALGGLVDIQLAVEHPSSALPAAVICIAAQQSTAGAPVAESLAAWAGCQSQPASTEAASQAALPVQALEGLARLQNADAPLPVQVCTSKHILKVLYGSKSSALYSFGRFLRACCWLHCDDHQCHCASGSQGEQPAGCHATDNACRPQLSIQGSAADAAQCCLLELVH